GKLKQQKSFCLDLETTSRDAMQAEIIGWAVSWQEGTGYYVPVAGPVGQATLPREMVAGAFKPILENPNTELINQNVKYDLLVLRRVGIEPASIGVDPMVGDYLLDAGARSHGLDALAEKYLGHKTIPITDLIGTGSKQKSLVEIDIPKVAEYAAEDAQVGFALAGRVRAELERENLWDLHWQLERPLVGVLADTERGGILGD